MNYPGLSGKFAVTKNHLKVFFLLCSVRAWRGGGSFQPKSNMYFGVTVPIKKPTEMI